LATGSAQAESAKKQRAMLTAKQGRIRHARTFDDCEQISWENVRRGSRLDLADLRSSNRGWH
jgi:hypothetical protein